MFPHDDADRVASASIMLDRAEVDDMAARLRCDRRSIWKQLRGEYVRGRVGVLIRRELAAYRARGSRAA